jgi:hypothetical protein
MDLIKLEIEQLKHQIELLEAVYYVVSKEQTKKEVSYCDSLKNLYNYYYASILHKFRVCNRKEE